MASTTKIDAAAAAFIGQEAPPIPEIWFSTDVETNGGDVERNSMLSFATIACVYTPADGKYTEVGTFSRQLQLVPGRVENEDTMKFWAENKEAYAAARKHPEDPAKVMKEYAAWCTALMKKYNAKACVSIAYPAAFDMSWILAYMQKYNKSYEPLWFRCYDIRTYAASVLKQPLDLMKKNKQPLKRFVSGHLTHDPIDDARQQLRTFCNLHSTLHYPERQLPWKPNIITNRSGALQLSGRGPPTSF